MSPRGSIPRDRRRGLLIAVLVLVLAAALFWAVFWIQSADSALTLAPQLDEAYYLREGARWRAEGGPGDRPFIMSPGYTLLVALGGGRAPEDGVLPAQPALLLALQALAWLGAGLLVGGVVRAAGIGAGLGPRRALLAGLVAALLFFLYRPAAIYARTVLLDLPLAFLVTAAVAAILAPRPGPLARAVLAGLCLGLAAALRAHVLVLLLVLLPVTVRAARGRRRGALTAGALVLLAALPVTLAALHNTRVTGRLAGPSLNAGVNLYLGQHPDARGLFTTLAGFDFEHDPSGETFLETRQGDEVAGPGEADRRWRAEALARLRAHPGRAVARWFRKVWLHVQGWEIAQVTPLSAWPREAPVLRVLPVPWWLLMALGLTGAAAASRALPRSPARPDLPWRRDLVVWALVVALLVAVQSLFFVVSRYRLVLAPPLAVLAGLGLVALLAPAGPGECRRWLAPAVALPLALLLTIPWGLDDVRRSWRGLEDLNLARRLMVTDRPGDREAADGLLAEACVLAAARGQPWRLRAENLAALGREQEALLTLAEGILNAEDPAPLERTRIALLRQMGRLDEAEALSLSFLSDAPQDLDVLHDLAVLQGHRGRWAAAAATAQRLRDAAPADHRGWLDLAVALARLGRREEAAATLREGLARVPEGRGRELLAENLRRLEAAAGGG